MASLVSTAILVACWCCLPNSDATILRWIYPAYPSATGRANSTVSVMEGVPKGTEIMRLRAETSGALVSYSLESSSVPGLFHVDNESGTLSVHQFVDYEVYTMATVTVSARDDLGGTGSITVDVNVINVNDNAPRFDRTMYNVDLVGDKVMPGTDVLRVNAVDADGDRLTYALGGGNTNNTFAIGANSGMITLASTQTLAKMDRFALLVTAVDGGAPIRNTGSTSVNIRVLHDVTSVIG